MTEAYYEHIPLAIRPATMERLEPLIRQAAADEWEDECVARELGNLAEDFRSRLQRITKGDLQR